MYQSKILARQITREESVALLDHLKKKEEDFRTVVAISQLIKKACNEDDLMTFKQLIDNNIPKIPYLMPFLDESFDQAVLYRYDDIIQYFFTNGYQLDETTQKYLPTLMHSCRFFRNDPPMDLIVLLVKNGADIESSEGDNFKTTLHLACKYGIKEVIKQTQGVINIRFLVDEKADINSVDRKKRTPLYYILKSVKKFPELEEAVEYMKQKGAKLNWKE